MCSLEPVATSKMVTVPPFAASGAPITMIVPSEDTARIQEMHILIGHIICQLVDFEYTQT